MQKVAWRTGCRFFGATDRGWQVFDAASSHPIWHRRVSVRYTNKSFLSTRKPNHAVLRGGNITESDFLSRSTRYGITTIAELEAQSNFELSSGHHQRLTDDPQYRTDLDLWNLLLDYRIQHYGSKGASTIWRGLKFRNPRVCLDSDDALTDQVWRKLLQCAADCNDIDLIRRLCERDGIAWGRPKLFAETISALLRAGGDDQVDIICSQFKGRHEHGVVDVLELYNTFRPQNYREMKQFCNVHAKLRSGKMYSKSVPDLVTNHRIEEAFMLHRFLISRGDFPSTFDEIEPFLKYFAKRSEDPDPFLRHLAATGVVFHGRGRVTYDYQNLQFDSRLTGSAIEKIAKSEISWNNRISDGFSARAFATKALSFDFVLNALRAFGLIEVGPQSLREIGLAASDLESLSIRLAKLDELQIDTGGSAYSRFIRTMCLKGERKLLEQALRTDMHHDVFEDTQLQQRLLIESLNKCDWSRINLLLAMLNHARVSSLDASVRSAFLSSVISDNLKPRTLLTMISNLTNNSSQFTSSLVSDLTDHLISGLGCVEIVSNASRARHRDLVCFTAGLLQKFAANGISPSDAQWRTLLLHLAQCGAFNEVHSLILWLSVSADSGARHRQPNPSTKKVDSKSLKHIVDTRVQGQILRLALREQFKDRTSQIRQPWQTTLNLLRYLEEKNDVPIQVPTIEKNVSAYVQNLYGKSSMGQGLTKSCPRRSDYEKLYIKLSKSLDQPRPSISVTSDKRSKIPSDNIGNSGSSFATDSLALETSSSLESPR